mmetsp:Transcript_32763/g.75794  ORF Transcript_32763/g.75794 Transcript_32763/m.75794 type:complete len:607 (+) Transcript_32763:86-1906(+)
MRAIQLCFASLASFAPVVVVTSEEVLAKLRGTAGGSEPNPPTWPDTVRVFDPSDDDIQSVLDAAYATNGGHDPAYNGQFSDARYAFMFKPGSYDVDVPVGYYTHIIGLGDSPDDVVFNGPKGVYVDAGSYDSSPAGDCLSNFWRAAEGFSMQGQTYEWWSGGAGMLWAVSQAAPLRRVKVDNTLNLYQYVSGDAAGFSSGGYMANVEVGGSIVSGSQQQWFARNSKFGEWSNGVWNQVFVGSIGAPASHCGLDGGSPYTTVDETPSVAEKPFIIIDSTSGEYSLVTPALKTGSVGTEFDNANAKIIPFSDVYVASADSDDAASINAKLNAGLHVVLSPGIYELDAPIEVKTEGQVLLGLGYATLVSSNGNAVVTVGDVDNVRLAGFLMQAGPTTSDALLVWGTDAGYAGDADAPGLMSDVFARVGGPDEGEVSTDVMVHLRAGNVMIENTWLWRADHSATGGVYDGANPVKNGLVVDGDDVTTYGLAVEHTLEDLTVWNGEGGQVYFYQSELPYDVDQASWGDNNFVGYRVSSDVQTHDAYGVGVYTYFRDYNVSSATGISAPAALEPSFVNPLAVHLNGYGSLTHVINDKGNATSDAGETAYVCP